MSPTLILLVDDSKETLIDNIGSMLLVKLIHSDGEVRKYALDVIYTIASNAKTSEYNININYNVVFKYLNILDYTVVTSVFTYNIEQIPK